MSNIRFAYTNYLEGDPNVVVLNGAPATVATCTWANGSAVVTTAANFNACTRWALLSGALAAFFPAGTRIQNIDTPTQVTMSANANAAFTSPQSGTFTPDFALTQDPDYPATNLFNGSRNVPYYANGTATPYSLLLDLGQTRTVALLAGLGFRSYTAGGLGSTLSFQWATTYGSYSAESAASNVYAAPDYGLVLSPTSMRFVKLIFRNTTTFFELGRAFAGPIDQDLGISFFPGTTGARVKNERQIIAPGDAVYRQTLGRQRRSWALAYDDIPQSIWDKLAATFDQPAWPILIDNEDLAYEVRWSEGRLDWAWKYSSLYGSNVSIEQLP